MRRQQVHIHPGQVMGRASLGCSHLELEIGPLSPFSLSSTRVAFQTAPYLHAVLLKHMQHH